MTDEDLRAAISETARLLQHIGTKSIVHTVLMEHLQALLKEQARRAATLNQGDKDGTYP